MNFKSLLPASLAAFALALAVPALTYAQQTEADVIAKARASYPLKTCLVSDESLGSMGDAVPYVHRASGQPDRVVFVCCEGCIDDFKQNPAKFLKKVDDAAAKSKAEPGKKKKSKA